ncbi:MAG: hypothetical protein CL936_04845 [Deltaproteobacteria bacterium]|nr:hypothetical protein [Deltaproteobacteria bacterium]OUW49581.1 MAG: hypothetical protein CBD47_01600 [Synechococcus sp. TMED187]
MTPNSISATVVAAVAAWALAPAPARANDPPSKANAPSTGSIRIVGADRTSPTGGRWAETDAEVHGRLAFLRLDLFCDGSDPRRARRAFADTLGLNFIDHFPRLSQDAAIPTEISLSVRNVTASEALELLIDASSGTQRGAWQVRDGILEMGPRPTLARRTRPITRVIDVTDQLLEAPYFMPSPEENPLTPDGVTRSRRSPREVGADLVESIVNTVDPDAWHPVTEAELADGVVDPVDPRDPHRGRNLNPKAIDPITRNPIPIYVQGRWATIRLKSKAIVVRAPAFVLMGIEGLPKPVPPPASMLEVSAASD